MRIYEKVTKLCWPAWMATCMTVQTVWLQPGIGMAWSTLVFVFCAVIFAYNFDHKDVHIRWIGRGFGLLTVIFAMNLSIYQFKMLISAAFLLLSYYGFRWPRRQKGLRGVIWLKPVIIGMVWSIFTVLLIVPDWTMAIERLLLVAALALVYDIVDLYDDHAENFVTLVTYYGIKTIQKWVYGCLICSEMLVVFQGFPGKYSTVTVFLLTLSTVLTGWGIYIILQKKARIWVSKFWIDGLMGIPFLILFVYRFFT